MDRVAEVKRLCVEANWHFDSLQASLRETSRITKRMLRHTERMGAHIEKMKDCLATIEQGMAANPDLI